MMSAARWLSGFVIVGIVSMLAALSAGTVAAAPISSPTTPGTVLSQSAIGPQNLPSDVGRGLRLLYVTRDQDGHPVTSTGALYLPPGTPPAGGWPVFSWAHGTSGISDACSPSQATGAFRDDYEPAIAAAMRAGYAVTATDYPGQGSGGRTEYLGGRAEGSAVVDMIRAARSVVPSLSTRWVSSGHSQGGHAGLWAAYLGPTYAPELQLKGAVVYAPATHIEQVVPMLAPGVPNLGQFNSFTGLILYILNGLDHARPDLHVQSYLSPLGREWFDRVRGLCVFDLGPALAKVTPGSLVVKPFTDPRFTAALDDYLGVPVRGYRVPIQIEHGTSDVTVPFPLSLATVAQMRSAGTDVTFLPYPGADHQAVTVVGQRDAFAAVARYFR